VLIVKIVMILVNFAKNYLYINGARSSVVG
jgi:hypothetical protein